MTVYASEVLIPPKLWRWRYFSPREVRCKGTGKVGVVPEFLDRLSALRTAYGKPMTINSWYRSPEYNMKVSRTGPNGPHTTGRAVDVRVNGSDAVQLMMLALDLGFTGYGFNQAGARESRFLHLDDLIEPPHPRPNVWTY